MYCDTHLHTSFSGDSETPPRQQIEKAISLQMPALCITDHMDFDYPPCECVFEFSTEDYFRELSALRRTYADRIDLRIGVELGLQPHLTDRLRSYASSWPFDYIIGSTHIVGGVDPYDAVYFEGKTDEEAHRRYFEEVYANLLAFHDFDSLGHLDYVVRYGKNGNRFYSWEKHQEIIDEILKALIRWDICLECNTAGLRAGLGHPNPTEGILRRYRELGGGGITLGSDAHQPEYLGFAFDSIGECLKSCGFSEYVVFENHKPHLYAL